MLGIIHSKHIKLEESDLSTEYCVTAAVNTYIITADSIKSQVFRPSERIYTLVLT